MCDDPILLIGFSDEIEITFRQLFTDEKIINPIACFTSPLDAANFLFSATRPHALFALTPWNPDHDATWFSPLLPFSIPWIICYENREDREKVAALNLGKIHSLRLPLERQRLFESMRAFGLEWKILSPIKPSSTFR